MEMQPTVRAAIAELKLGIIMQRQLAASMARSGDVAKARSARDTLLKLLFKLDLLERGL
jgi:hypothetical protein